MIGANLTSLACHGSRILLFFYRNKLIKLYPSGRLLDFATSTPKQF